MANVRNAVTGWLGYLFGAGNCRGSSATRVAVHRHMGKKAADKISTGAELDALTAQKVFGWKHVHKHDGELIGKKQDKAGRWRSAKVPSYSTDPVHAYAIGERMKQLGRSERYLKELSRITRAKRIPTDWATPEQRAKAALKASK